MRTRVRFIGRVQGVGFRATVQDCARRLAINGWVRNEPDGSVLLEAQGDEQELAALISQVRARMHAYIRGMDRTVLPDLPDEHEFRIER